MSASLTAVAATVVNLHRQLEAKQQAAANELRAMPQLHLKPLFTATNNVVALFTAAISKITEVSLKLLKEANETLGNYVSQLYEVMTSVARRAKPPLSLHASHLPHLFCTQCATMRSASWS